MTLPWLCKLKFRLLRHATIKDIPTDRFKTLIDELKADGWRPTWRYQGFDAWIDDGALRLKKRFAKLSCEWDNWTEGRIEGPRAVIMDIAARTGLSVSHQWRWSEYDRK